MDGISRNTQLSYVSMWCFTGANSFSLKYRSKTCRPMSERDGTVVRALGLGPLLALVFGSDSEFDMSLLLVLSFRVEGWTEEGGVGLKSEPWEGFENLAFEGGVESSFAFILTPIA